MFDKKEYYIKEVLPFIGDNQYVMVGISALCYSGLSTANCYVPDLLTTIEGIDGVLIAGMVNYYYIGDIDYTAYVTPLKEVTNILIPTYERAIVECIKHDLRFADEGYFVEAVDRYLSFFYNRPLLEEVANHFGVPMEKVDYWLKESEDYNSY